MCLTAADLYLFRLGENYHISKEYRVGHFFKCEQLPLYTAKPKSLSHVPGTTELAQPPSYHLQALNY